MHRTYGIKDESTLVMEGETMEEAFRHQREASISGIENHFKKLQKLLEAERLVMAGLVNGAIGTVMGIHATHISIKCDHIHVPCDKEMGLSLNTAIIDLSTDVFGDGMGYVALSRVRTFNGLHLLSFDPLCVKVSNLCINEIKRLRSKFRKHLPQIKKSKGKKRKTEVTDIIDDGEPCSKNVKVSVSHVQSTSNSTISSNKRKNTDLQMSNCPKNSKICDDNALKKPCRLKEKIDIDISTDNTALIWPCSKKDDKLF
uniref:Uncharacterized protein n=1 Tax=Amphimedon queenslandica TaxID=400682 RepID=A0A1X7VY80_AMPQE